MSVDIVRSAISKGSSKLWILALVIALGSFALSGCNSDSSEGSSSSMASSNESSVAEQSSQQKKLSEAGSFGADFSQKNLTENQETAMTEMEIAINGQSFTASLEDNETSRAFLKLLPLDLDMQELNGNEKYFFLPEPLPANPTSISAIEAGDVMLYQDDCIVIFYESHSTSYKYTRIGKIEDARGLAEAVGKGFAKVDFKTK